MAAIARKPAAKRMWLIIAGTIAALYLASCAAMYMAQAKLIFYPGPPPVTTPREKGLEFREVSLRTRDGEGLHAWFIPADKARATVLVCHGNAGNIESRIALAESFHRMGLAVLLFDYRGYGRSSGTPTEEGTYLDAEAAHDHLRDVEHFDARAILLFGESMGGAPAIELALRRPVGAVIVEDTFTSMPDMGAKLYPWLPIRLLSRFQYDSLSKIGRVNAPVMIIHSPQDELVPFEHGRKLFDAAREPKKFLETAGEHNACAFYSRAEWVKSVQAFIEGVL